MYIVLGRDRDRDDEQLLIKHSIAPEKNGTARPKSIPPPRLGRISKPLTEAKNYSTTKPSGCSPPNAVVFHLVI